MMVGRPSCSFGMADVQGVTNRIFVVELQISSGNWNVDPLDVEYFNEIHCSQCVGFIVWYHEVLPCQVIWSTGALFERYVVSILLFWRYLVSSSWLKHQAYCWNPICFSINVVPFIIIACFEKLPHPKNGSKKEVFVVKTARCLAEPKSSRPRSENLLMPRKPVLIQ